MLTRSAPRALVALALSGMLGGCLFMIPHRTAPKPVVQVKMLGTAPAGAPAGEVQVYRSTQDLPRGFFFARQAGGRVKLYAAPGYPSTGQPDVVIAGMAATTPNGAMGYLNPRDIETAFVAKARELGANGLFIGTGDPRVGYAIHVSAAQAADQRPPAKVLLAEVTRKVGGYQPAAAPTRHDMAAGEPITFDARRGDCYLLGFALDTDGELGPRAQSGILIDSHSGDPLMSNRSTMAIEEIGDVDGFQLRAPTGGHYLHLRSGSLALGCAWTGGPVQVTIRGFGRSALGQGHYLARVYKKHVSEAELKRKKAANDRAVAQAEAENARYRAEEAERERQREAERQQREAERQQREAERASQRSSSGGGGGGASGYYSFSLKNECDRTVRLKITSSSGDPKFAGGTETSIGANTIQSYSGTGPKYFWIIDDSGNGISSFTASSGQRDMQVTRGCSGFAPKF